MMMARRSVRAGIMVVLRLNMAFRARLAAFSGVSMTLSRSMRVRSFSESPLSSGVSTAPKIAVVTLTLVPMHSMWRALEYPFTKRFVHP